MWRTVLIFLAISLCLLLFKTYYSLKIRRGKAGDEQATNAHSEHLAGATIFLSSFLPVRHGSRSGITTTRDVCERACM